MASSSAPAKAPAPPPVGAGASWASGDGGEKARQAPRLYVGSEVGTLRRVMLHRPDHELRRLTPANKDELLFDDVLWVKRARQEHDAFADTLRHPRDSGRTAGPALEHAPRHGDDDGRPRRLHRLPRAARGDDRLHPAPRSRTASNSPGATASRHSASSGTTATTSSHWSLVSSSPTTATPTPTRCYARPASRSSLSAAPSLGAVAAAAIA